MTLRITALFVSQILFATAAHAAQTIHYVDADSTSPAPPYTNWAGAARSIQDAINIAGGDLILVSNGVYGPIRATNSVAIRAVNGAAVTMIDGQGTEICAHFRGAATLSGFTLRHGVAGVYGESTNLNLVSDCWMMGNIVYGGAYHVALSNCLLSANSAYFDGGGASQCILSYCTLRDNSTPAAGGGALSSTLNNCLLIHNSAQGSGGGSAYCRLNNCVLSGNQAGYGGGDAGSVLTNCTLTGNSAGYSGGALSSTLYNCIVYFNHASIANDNAPSSTMSFCCTTPLPLGTGNISADPLLADSAHLSAASPCRGAGSAAFVAGVDIDGEAWANPPSIGCDEYHAGSVTNSLSVSIRASYTQVAAGFAVDLTGQIIGHATDSRWEFGDGTVASNHLAISHIWLTPGDYQVTLRAYNDSYPAGVSASVTIHVVEIAVYYVSAGNTNATSPYNSWATAAANIQDAVNAASTVPGSLVLVTNGIYNSGGALDTNTLTPNRVAVTKVLILRSVNGPAVTIIDAGSGGTNFRRCVFLGHGSALAGFTLTNGGSTNGSSGVLNGGGVYCADESAVVSNCVVRGNFAFEGAGAYRGTLNSCVLTGNVARWDGGGAYYAELNDCTLTGNSGDPGGATGGQLNRCVVNANSGGGVANATLTDCSISQNNGCGVSWSTLSRCVVTSNYYGGGAYVSTLFNCYVAGNSTTNDGGGANASKLFDCVLTGNSARNGGGTYGGVLNNCTIFGNSAQYGGGAYGGPLNNCTVTGNSAQYGGGVYIAYYGGFNNTILYYNHASEGDNYLDQSGYTFFQNCCTTPLPPDGTNNISSEPELVDFSHISSGSPCRGAGSSTFTSGVDIDGEAWLNPPSIGCDEYYTGSSTGALSVAIQASYTNVAPGAVVTFSGEVFAHANSNRWDFGDGSVVSNRLFVSHSWAAIGDYTVVFRAYNETYPSGISAAVTIHVLPPSIHYVDAASLTPSAPYTNWATAARTIQDAVDAASFAGAIVLVTNGTYASGGAPAGPPYGSNRVAVTKPLSIRSINGPDVTVIQGDRSTVVRCVYLTNGASLSGFTLTNGSGPLGGGGVWCDSTDAAVSNCVLIGNDGGGHRGTYQSCMFLSNAGPAVTVMEQAILTNCVLNWNNVQRAAYQSTLDHCVISSNYYSGAEECALVNCTLSGNRVEGAYGGFLTNCTITGNGEIGASYSTLVHCNVVGNSVGVEICQLYNSIVYYNSSGNDYPYYAHSIFNYCCTTPMPTNGIGNISAEPLLADSSHISPVSPCRGAGNAAYTSGTDIDGEAWLNPPSIGCDEYRAGGITGPLNVSITASFTNVATGFLVNLSGQINGHASSNQWDFSDGATSVNRQFASHTWNTAGDYIVKFHVYNESNPGGITATLMIHVRNGIHYVSLRSTTPVPPFLSWATAATNIQDAINVAYAGGTVLVSNGLYSPIIATNPVAIRTVNGVTNTAIDGGGATNCVRLDGPATLSGFTLTNGIGHYAGGGVYSSSENLVSDCVLVNNTATDGGGGASYTTLSNCWLIGNSAGYQGGGAQYCTLYDCVLIGNSATNSYYGSGGGAVASRLNNCALIGNRAWVGGGVDGGDYSPSLLNNCTLTGNLADYGGGAEFATLNNCIVYFNHARIAGDNFSDSTLNFCCATPLPPGPGNVGDDPLLTDSSHLSADSPCRGAGSPAYALGLDIDGESWLNPPSIGCDEFHAGASTGPLAVSIQADHNEVAAGFAVNLVGQITGHAFANWWNFGDGTFATNRLSIAHSWATPGNYQVVLTAYNDTYPAGVSATLTVHVVATPVYYVAASNATPVAPYTNWTTAATSIQDAVNAASTIPGALVLVTNGLYNTGGAWIASATETNRVAVTNLLTVRSVNGPAMTVIDALVGNSAPWRCVYLGSGATLDGFTLTNGGVSSNSSVVVGSGGGIRAENYAAVVTNCVLGGNKASSGGGAYNGTLNNCALIGNSGGPYGGGASGSMLNNCTLTGNSATGDGGGAYNATLNNCTVTGNSARGGGGAFGGTLSQCILSKNFATYGGGGGEYATLLNCTLRTNAASYGGGASESDLDNCVLIGNTATNYGGGVFNTTYSGTLNNCTVVGNWAQFGGGVCAAYSPGQHQQVPQFNNCILYYNHTTNGTGDNFFDYNRYHDSDVHGLLNNCCTTPLPTNGVANITDAPLFVDLAAGDFHLQSSSPCINAGSNSFGATTTDLDGGPRILGGIVDIGAYEFHPSHAPVADAGATHTPAVSANGTNATVILDGSRSSDSNGYMLQYTWYEASNWLASGVVAVRELPLGAHPILLVVSDGFLFSTNAITVEVLTPAQAVQRLESIVNASVARPRPLLTSLDAALAAILRNNSVPAINDLKGFQTQVKAQVLKEDAVLAASLTQSAQDIIDALSGGKTNPGHPRQFTSISLQPESRVRMQFAGDAGALYLIESSTNLVDWELIGVATSITNGQYQFDDKEAGRFARRYYRLRSR
jgi:uncharacterized protein YdeI (BOF family)